jgi:hypothetical protein
MVLPHQKVCSGGEAGAATQLVDLFILQAYRSPQLVRRIYKEVERLCLALNIRFILALPNENATLLNARFLKLSPLLWLQIRAGFGWPGRSKLAYSGLFKSMTKNDAIDLLSGFSTPTTENGLHWDGEILFDRLSDPTCDYAVHATADLLLISSSRKTKGIRYALLCWLHPSRRPRCGLLRMRSLMVRSASSRVSNHEATGEAATIRTNRKTL